MFNFLSLLKKATVIAETSRTIYFLASVNLSILLTKFFNMPGYTPNISKYIYMDHSKQGADHQFEAKSYVISVHMPSLYN